MWLDNVASLLDRFDFECSELGIAKFQRSDTFTLWLCSLTIFHGRLSLNQYLNKFVISSGWLESHSCSSKYTCAILSVAALIHISESIHLFVINLWLRTTSPWCCCPLSLSSLGRWDLLAQSSKSEWGSMIRFETVTCIYLETQSMACIWIFEVINSSAIKVSTVLFLCSSLKLASWASSWVSVGDSGEALNLLLGLFSSKLGEIFL